jgi:hypothetical protein
MRTFRLLSTSLACLSLAACWLPSKIEIIPLHQALSELRVSLGDDVLTLQEAEAEPNPVKGANSPLYTKFAKFQCAVDPKTGKADADQRKYQKNPLIPVINGAIQLQVQGQASAQGQLAIGVPLVATGTVNQTRQKQEQFTLPASLIPLSEVPTYYLSQQLAALQSEAALETNLSKSNKHNDGKDGDGYRMVSVYIRETSYKLTKIANDAMEQFGSDGVGYCSQVQPTGNSAKNAKGEVLRMEIRTLTLPN